MVMESQGQQLDKLLRLQEFALKGKKGKVLRCLPPVEMIGGANRRRCTLTNIPTLVHGPRTIGKGIGKGMYVEFTTDTNNNTQICVYNY